MFRLYNFGREKKKLDERNSLSSLPGARSARAKELTELCVQNLTLRNRTRAGLRRLLAFVFVRLRSVVFASICLRPALSRPLLCASEQTHWGPKFYKPPPPP